VRQAVLFGAPQNCQVAEVFGVQESLIESPIRHGQQRKEQET